MNGVWLFDESGNKIPTTGQSGKDGKDGENGTDGITPQLKIEDSYWLISYDNGQTWDRLGKAVGEDGKAGDSFFKSVYPPMPYYSLNFQLFASAAAVFCRRF